jgi:hypothetical protein
MRSGSASDADSLRPQVLEKRAPLRVAPTNVPFTAILPDATSSGMELGDAGSF